MSSPDDMAIEAALQAFWDTETEGSGLDDMRRAIAAYEAAMWQPLASLPTDETVLVYSPPVSIVPGNVHPEKLIIFDSAPLHGIIERTPGHPRNASMRWRHLPATPAPESRSCDGAKGGTEEKR